MAHRPPLTDLAIKNLPLLPTGQKIVWDSLPGFGIRLSAGNKTFLIKYQNRFITLGPWPHLSLKKARQEAMRVKAEHVTYRHVPRSLTYLEAVDAFLEERTPHLRPNSLRSYTRHLKCFHFSTKLAELTQHDLARQLKSLATRPSEHNHVVGTWIIFFGWCIKREYVTRNPALNLPQFPKNRRTRVLTDQELKAVWTAAGQITGHFGTLVRCLILMGQRVTETASIQTSWIQNQTITFPRDITKNKKEHTIPIGNLSHELLRTLCDKVKETSTFLLMLSTPLFPARGKGDRYFTGRHQMANLRKLSGFKDFTLHDLRRTYRTTLPRLKVPPHICERLLNHTSARTELEKIYDHHNYFEEMQDAVLKYEQHLIKILELD